MYGLAGRYDHTRPYILARSGGPNLSHIRGKKDVYPMGILIGCSIDFRDVRKKNLRNTTEEYDAGCFQSICGFIFRHEGLSVYYGRHKNINCTMLIDYSLAHDTLL